MKNNVELNIDLIIEEYSHYVFTVVYNIAGDTLSYHDIEEIIADTFYLFWKNPFGRKFWRSRWSRHPFYCIYAGMPIAM